MVAFGIVRKRSHIRWKRPRRSGRRGGSSIGTAINAATPKCAMKNSGSADLSTTTRTSSSTATSSAYHRQLGEEVGRHHVERRGADRRDAHAVRCVQLQQITIARLCHRRRSPRTTMRSAFVMCELAVEIGGCRSDRPSARMGGSVPPRAERPRRSTRRDGRVAMTRREPERASRARHLRGGGHRPGSQRTWPAGGGGGPVSAARSVREPAAGRPASSLPRASTSQERNSSIQHRAGRSDHPGSVRRRHLMSGSRRLRRRRSGSDLPPSLGTSPRRPVAPARRRRPIHSYSPPPR